ncbi:MAG TPA: hypothetical protein VN709_13010 [Terriglobales bacterium]|nr:hypothetical protein [Terriglobales bacterium]
MGAAAPAEAPIAAYSRRLALAQAAAGRARQGEIRLAWAKIVAVFAFLGLAWASIIGLAFAALWLLLPLAVLVYLFVAHGGAILERERSERKVRFYQRGLARLRAEPTAAPAGERFRDPQHVYADDLDLFGPGSLFQLLSTARTPMGEERLAAWLRAPASVATLRDRQRQVAELRPQLDLRERAGLLGDELKQRLDPRRLATWAQAPPRFIGTVPRLLDALVAAATVAAAIYSLAGGGLSWLIALIALQLILVLPRDAAISASAGDRGANSEGLRTFASVLALAGDQEGAGALLRLAQLADWSSASGSTLGRVLDVTVLYSLQVAFFVDAWRARYGASIGAWIESVGEFEALLSLSSHAYEHPLDPFPELVDAPAPLFEASELGHPLIPEENCVRNDVALNQQTRVWLVSGSNMSGKSTLLRTIGVNTVLALAGAPVRARSLRLTPLALGTRLRTSDSLQQGRSGYYAEILRLRQVFELTRGFLPVLFMFDELMEGTNSHDRVIGSKGLLRSLLARPSIGLVTTHDLALAALAPELGPEVRNVHFEDQIEGNDIRFDHRLRDGVVTKSNALALMRIIGLEV